MLPPQFVPGRPDLQAHVVPRFGKPERGQAVHRGHDVLTFMWQSYRTMYPRFQSPSGTHSPCAPGRKPVSPWLVVLALSPGIFLTLADATVMSVAVPLIIRRLEGW